MAEAYKYDFVINGQKIILEAPVLLTDERKQEFKESMESVTKNSGLVTRFEYVYFEWEKFIKSSPKP
jgi:hypothetical protein